MGGSSKKQTVGYKYYLGIHMVLVHGPIDYLKRIVVDGRTAWRGRATGGPISISQANLFGGESREGGISGSLDVDMGYPDQPRNSYLQGQLGFSIPAFRGVVSIILKKFYLGMNPYLKRWSFRAQRIHVRQNGLEQWYNSRAAIPNPDLIDQVLNETFPSLSGYSVISGSSDDFNLVSDDYGSCLEITGVENIISVSRLRKTLPGGSQDWDNIRIKFKIVSYDDEDCGVFEMFDSSGNLLFNFTPVRDKAVDPSRRAHISFSSGTSGLILSNGVLDIGVWYQLNLLFNGSNISGDISEVVSGTIIKSHDGSSIFTYAPVASVVFRNENFSDNGGVSRWDDIQIFLGTHSDMNPAHIIRECLTDPDWGMGYPETDIDDESFEAAADKLFSESMGISLLWDRQMALESFVQEVVKHISATLYVSRTTGKFVLKLIRDDYILEDLLVVGEADIEKIENSSRPNYGELVNSITVNYWDAGTGGTGSITVQDSALIQQEGSVINTTLQFPGFTNRSICSKVALRNLRSFSTPLLNCTVYTNRKTSGLNIGDVFRLVWPNLEIDTPVRIQGMALGDGKNNRVKLTVVEDVFGLPKSSPSTTDPGEWVDPISEPEPCIHRLLVEAPYYEVVQMIGQTDADLRLNSSPETGYIIQSAVAPPGSAINSVLSVNSGTGYEDSAILDFCPTALLSSPLSYTSTTISVSSAEELDDVTVGTHAQIDDEIVRIDDVDLDLLVITVGRGCLDTCPRPHSSGTRIFFWDVYSVSDSTEYLMSEEIFTKVLPTTGQGTLDISVAPEDSVILNQRAFRPYPPGDFRVDGLSYPVSYSPVGTSLEITWAHRDRIQQTSGFIYDHTEGDIGPEAGVSYRLDVDAILDDSTVDEDWLSIPISGSLTTYVLDLLVNEPPEGCVALGLKLYSVRDELDSWQFNETVVVILTAPFALEAEYVDLTPPTDLDAEYYP